MEFNGQSGVSGEVEALHHPVRVPGCEDDPVPSQTALNLIKKQKRPSFLGRLRSKAQLDGEFRSNQVTYLLFNTGIPDPLIEVYETIKEE